MKVDFVWHDSKLPSPYEVAERMSNKRKGVEFRGDRESIDDQGAEAYFITFETDEISKIQEYHSDIRAILGFEARVLINDLTLLQFLDRLTKGYCINPNLEILIPQD